MQLAVLWIILSRMIGAGRPLCSPSQLSSVGTRLCYAMFLLQSGLQDSVMLCLSLCHRKTRPANGNRGLGADPAQQQLLHHLPVTAFIWKVQQQVLMRMMNRVVLFWENPARAQRSKCCMIFPRMGSAQCVVLWSEACWCCAAQGSQHLRGCKIICKNLSFLC